MILRNEPTRVLLVDDDEDDYVMTRDLIADIPGQPFELSWEPTYAGGIATIGRHEHDVYLLDYRLGGQSGLDLLCDVIERGCRAPVILLTGQGDREIDIRAMKAGAADYLVKGRIDASLLDRSIRHAIERNATQQTLHEREELFRSAFEHTNVATVLTDLNHRFVRINPAFANMFGYSESEMLQLSMPDITHPDDLAPSLEGRKPLVAGTSRFFQIEKRYLHSDGHVIWGLTNVSMVLDAHGQPFRFVGQVQDITEKRKFEEQFHQAQKMEAVGQLAGGVAHDFNNLLTIINGYSDFILAEAPNDSPLKEYAQAIGQAGVRAASLTRQLLAFSRKQLLEARELDLNTIAADTAKMLQRLIGEDIDLRTVLAPRLGTVKADLGQLEQVIMNLVVNARDAMPRGGRLTIETANTELDETYTRAFPGLRPGRYVMLAVADTGTGMDEATKARIFEPFFTTKEPGKGTGLGLSTVFGIVKQSEGHVAVYSELGRGTTFKVYLPMSEEPVGSENARLDPTQVLRGSETILLAEDEPALRALARHVLETHGYTVLEAGDGRQALDVAEAFKGTIHLLVTDVVMPVMSGRQLAERIALLRPDAKVLYVSGYTDDAVVRHGVLQSETPFLQKPFTPQALATKVREVLDTP